MTIKLNPIPQTPLRDDPTQDAIWKRFLQFWINKIQTLGTGSVTSVALAAPTEFVVSGSPVTGAGTLTLTKKVENANKGWFGPTTGADAQPTFRALVAADLPSGTGTVTSVDGSGGTTGLTLTGGPITTTGTLTLGGTLVAGNGGTGIASYAVGDILYASASGTLSKLADVAVGSVLTSGGVTTAPAWGQAPINALKPDALAFAANYG